MNPQSLASLNRIFQAPDGTPSRSLELHAVFLEDTTAVIVSVVGTLDVQTTPELWRCLKTAFEELEIKILILDFDACLYLDSAALGSLLVAQKLAETKQANLLLARPTPRIQRLFEKVSFTEIFQIVPTLADAAVYGGKEKEIG